MGLIDNASSIVALAPRGWIGVIARNPTPRATPSEPLQLYEFESCPYCRKVRETLSTLDLDYDAHPCAVGSRNRPVVTELGGRQLFPFLVDPGAGKRLYESEDIVTYLYDTYGSGRPTVHRGLAPLNTLGASLASALRPLGGRVKSLGRQPKKLLELWQFEGCPYCRKVREALGALDLNYRVRNVPRGGQRRAELLALTGRASVQVPFLVDPNTGTSMHESDDIIAYLRSTYG